MKRIKEFLLVKKGPNPLKIAPRLKFIGVAEIFAAIIFGGYHVLGQDIGLTTTVVPGLLFLLGIITAYCGVFFSQQTFMRE